MRERQNVAVVGILWGFGRFQALNSIYELRILGSAIQRTHAPPPMPQKVSYSVHSNACGPQSLSKGVSHVVHTNTLKPLLSLTAMTSLV